MHTSRYSCLVPQPHLKIFAWHVPTFSSWTSSFIILKHMEQRSLKKKNCFVVGPPFNSLWMMPLDHTPSLLHCEDWFLCIQMTSERAPRHFMVACQASGFRLHVARYKRVPCPFNLLSWRMLWDFSQASMFVQVSF